MRISQIATASPVTCHPDQSIARVAHLMRENDVGAVVVTDDEGRLLGIVTDRDVVVRGLARDLAVEDAVEHVMTHDVVHVSASADVDTALDQMAAWAVRRLPVLGADGRVRGMVTLDDLLLVLEQQDEFAVGPVRDQSWRRRRGLSAAGGLVIDHDVHLDLTGVPPEAVEAPAAPADVPSGW